jgi:hypothetical protein
MTDNAATALINNNLALDIYTSPCLESEAFVVAPNHDHVTKRIAVVLLDALATARHGDR